MSSSHKALLRLLLTEECNFRCKYCYAEKRRVYASQDVLTKVVELANRFDEVWVEFTGGEPLLAKDALFWTAEQLRGTAENPNKKIHLTLITNALLLDTQTIQRLIELEVAVRASADGTPQTSAINRRPTTGSPIAAAEQVLQNLASAAANGLNLSINAVITPQTALQTVESFFFLWDTTGAYVKVSPVLGQTWSQEAISIFKSELTRVRELISLHPRLFATERWLEQLRADIAHCEYVLGKPPPEDTLSLTIDPQGLVYSDEFEPRTRQELLIGSINQILKQPELKLRPKTSTQLIFERQIYPSEVLQAQTELYTFLRTHYLALIDVLAPYSSASQDVSVSESEALALVAPLKLLRQRIHGFVLTRVEADRNSIRYRFEKDKEVLELALLPKNSTAHPYARTRHFEVVVQSSTPIKNLSEEAKSLIKALTNLVRRNELSLKQT